jgi:hypothetical protein
MRIAKAHSRSRITRLPDNRWPVCHSSRWVADRGLRLADQPREPPITGPAGQRPRALRTTSAARTAHAARLDPVLRGGPNHHGHSPVLPRTLRTDEAAALPLTGGCVVRPAPAVLRPPPTPTRLPRYYGRLRRPPGSPPTSRCRPVIGRDAPTARSAGRRAGEGFPSSRRHLLSVPRPIRRGVLDGCTPGSSPLPWPSP